MVSKKKLLKNLQSFSPEEIADAIRAGVVTLYELGHDTEGQFTPLLKKQVKDILAQPVAPKVDPVTTSLHPDDADTISLPFMTAADDEAQTTPEPTAPYSIPPRENEQGYGDTPTRTGHTGRKAKPGMFRNPFSFKGRIRRLEYGFSFLIMVIVNIFMNAILAAIDSGGSEGLTVLYFILFVPYCWFSLAQGAKRCHDRGNPGWFQIIPFYGLWMLFAEGDQGTNEYGESPK